MKYLEKTICILLALWTPIAFAYNKFANSDGETLSPPTQVEMAVAILIDEKGEPRCKITGERHNEFLLSDRFRDFVERNSEAKDAFDEINALEECDDGDALYAEFALNPQDISIAGVPSLAGTGSLTGIMGRRLRFFIPSLGISSIMGCLRANPPSPPVYSITNSDTVDYALEAGVFGLAIGVIANMSINGALYNRVRGSKTYTLLFHTLAGIAGNVVCAVYEQLDKHQKETKR